MKKLVQTSIKIYDKFNKEKNICLSLSNQLRMLSKATISFLIKENTITAEKNFPEMKKLFDKIQTMRKNNPNLHSVPAINFGIEEYIEALFLNNYLNNKPLPSISILQVSPAVYFGGLSDLTGELVRLARKHHDRVEKIYAYINTVYENLIPVNISGNNTVRTKLEAVGGNLKKAEGIIYDLKLRDKI